MGIGSIIISLASVIIGEAIFRHRSMFIKVLGVILGSIIFRLAVALAMHFGLDPNDLKLITAFFVLTTLVVTGTFAANSTGMLKVLHDFLLRIRAWSLLVLFGLLVLFTGYRLFVSGIFEKKSEKLMKMSPEAVAPPDETLISASSRTSR